MATHDYSLANQSGASFRTDLNNALAAIQSNNSNSSSPATTVAYQWWADTTSGTLKIRNSANNAWIELLQLDGTLTLEDGSASTPALAARNDLNTGVFFAAADKFNVAAGGSEMLEIGNNGIIFNEEGRDADFRIESDTRTHMFFLDAGNNRIGINTSSPSEILHVVHNGGSAAEFRLENDDGYLFISADSNIALYSAEQHIFRNRAKDTEYGRFDSDGKLKIGTTATPTQSGALNVFGTADTTSQVSIRRGSADANGPNIHFQKSRNTTDGSHTVVQNDDLLGQITFAGNDGAGPENGGRIKCEVDGNAGGNDMPARLVFAVTPDGSDTLSEVVKIRATKKIDLGVSGPSSRIDPTSSGNLIVEADPQSNYGSSNIQFTVDSHEVARMVAGTHRFFGLGRTSSQSNARCDINNESDQDVLFLTQNTNDTANRNLVMLHTGAQSGFATQIIFMDHQGVGRGTIKNNTSSTQYNTSSDYRLKENEVEISDGFERVKKLKPYKFNWKNRPDTIVDGFFAHEVEGIVEDCVDGTKDELYTETNEELKIKAGDPKYQQMDNSKLVPLLTAAIKEAISKIEVLETKVAAFEAA